MNPRAVAITANLASLDRRRRQLIAEQDSDSEACRLGLLPLRQFMRRWSKRQQERLNLETRYFWLLVSLEEVNNEAKI
jgi:hypothetical protein